MNTLEPVTSHQRQNTRCSMHRWLQLAPVDESCFPSKSCYSFKEGRTCNSKIWGGITQLPFGRQYVSEEVILALLYVFSTLVDFSFYFLDFSQRVFLHSSQGRSCSSWDTVACCLAWGAEGVVLWEGKEHVMLTWVVKAWTYLGKCPFIPSHTHSFSLDSYI